MLAVCFSFWNLAEWTPITTISDAYFSSSIFRSGMMCMQLMQQYVQKSSRTILPRSCFRLIGDWVLIQSRPGGKSGALVFPGYRDNAGYFEAVCVLAPRVCCQLAICAMN